MSVLVMLLIGGIGTALMWGVLRPRDETAAGIRALAATSWREFINMVLAALAQQGYSRVVDHETASGDTDFTLERDGSHWLLSCKHGSAYVLGKPAVAALANDIRMANAGGGFLVTQGRILDEARRPAAKANIELLDGTALWPGLRERIGAEQLSAIRSATTARARQRVLACWLVGLLAGVATFMFLPEPEPQARAAAPIPAASRAADTWAAEAPVTETLETQLPIQEQRDTVMRAAATLPMVSHALWSTQSTLELQLLDANEDAMPSICQLLERFPELATSRIQLTPPAGSGLPVRFRQCRTY
ncbi:restriction endonuclease [Luteimonas sp. A478]